MAEGTTQVMAGSAGSTSFEWPEEVPWSELGPAFIDTYGHDENGKFRAEHIEAMGQSGSGKSYAIGTILQQRAQRWGTACLGIITKNTDDSMPLLGWPEVGSYAELREKKYQWAMFWPKTELKGEEREAFHEKAIYELLSALWPRPGEINPVVIYIDEVRYCESLSRRLRKLIRMYWREGRSHGISIIAGAQRPLEMVRDQHSESRWKIVFKPADEADMQRFAEMLGPWREWAPVLRALIQEIHQFILKNTFTGDVYITWIDMDLRPLASQSADGQKPGGQSPHVPARRKAA